MNIIKISFKKILWAVSLACIVSGCSTPKNVAYFQGVENAEVLEYVVPTANLIKVQPFDKLSIIVQSKDAALAKLFNLNVVTNGASQRTPQSGTGSDFRDYTIAYNDGMSAYTVSADGTIDFPILGVLKVEGMTRGEVAAFIKGEIIGRGQIKDPVVTVEFLNTGFSVLGEVHRPGRYDLNKDVLTIVEALSLAGDLTIQGQRENIKVIRQEGDKTITYMVDISDSKNLLQSPAYFLKQGDVIYVEPNSIRKRQTVANANNVMNASFWLSVASLITTAAVLFKK
ncbi:MAG: polysaccharide biosynthesis/export family protein [Muribaculaceae bacterium]|nr:polysaccharide biosynthesis/export family protein [Muribaculaceae bacterium]